MANLKILQSCLLYQFLLLTKFHCHTSMFKEKIFVENKLYLICVTMTTQLKVSNIDQSCDTSTILWIRLRTIAYYITKVNTIPVAKWNYFCIGTTFLSLTLEIDPLLRVVWIEFKAATTGMPVIDSKYQQHKDCIFSTPLHMRTLKKTDACIFHIIYNFSSILFILKVYLTMH